jgi:hypothetical protein
VSQEIAQQAVHRGTNGTISRYTGHTVKVMVPMYIR